MLSLVAILTFAFLLTGVAAFSEVKTPSLWPIFHAEFSHQVKAKFHSELALELDTENPEYFGGSTFSQNRFVIGMGSSYQGHPEHEAMILCHELGHLLGGSPKKSDSTWASTETQSDFFAVSVCLKKMIRAGPGLFKKTLSKNPQYKILDEKCSALNANSDDKHLCRQVGRIGHDFFLAIHKFMDVPGFPEPRFMSQSSEFSRESKNKYPTLQCRMDVVLHGALCVNSKCTKPDCL